MNTEFTGIKIKKFGYNEHSIYWNKNLLAVYCSQKGRDSQLINDKICDHFVSHKEL